MDIASLTTKMAIVLTGTGLGNRDGNDDDKRRAFATILTMVLITGNGNGNHDGHRAKDNAYSNSTGNAKLM